MYIKKRIRIFRMMIRIFLCFAMFCIPFLGNAQGKDGFIINGQFSGLPDKTKVYLTTQERDTVATAVSNGEFFMFTGILPADGRFHFIKVDTLVTKVHHKSFFLINGRISVKGRIGSRDIHITGSSSHIDYIEFNSMISLINEKRKMILNELRNVNMKMKEERTDSGKLEMLEERKTELTKQQVSTYNEFKKLGQKWFHNHSNSLYAPYAIIGYKGIFNAEEIESEYLMLSSEAKNSYYGKKLKDEISLIKVASGVKEGFTIPNLTITTPDGIKVTLLEIASRNKYTLIDCWASWCGPCRAEIPTLKKIYNNFNNKGFNILGVSSDKNEAKWKKAMKEDATPWFHGIEDQDSGLLKVFDIDAIPSYILIDNKGKLIAFDCYKSKVKPFGGSFERRKARGASNLALG